MASRISAAMPLVERMVCRLLAVALGLCFAFGAVAQAPEVAKARLIKANPALAKLSDWKPRESLVRGVYTLHDPNGSYEPYGFDAGGRMLRTNRGWQPIDGGGLGEPLEGSDLKALHAKLFANLKLEEAIPLKFGSGAKSFVLLTALDCPMCKLLERNLNKVASKLSATIYVYPMALDYTNVQRMNIVTSMWCGPSPERAWSSAMAQPGVPSPAAGGRSDSCGVRTAYHSRALARLFGSYGVPALISADGAIRRGAPEPEELIALMR